MTPEMQPTGVKSSVPSPRLSRITLTLAAIGLAAVAAVSTIVLKSVGLIEWSIVDLFTESDEAPIRVRGGSIDIFVLSASQEWKQAGSSGNFNIDGTVRYKDEFEVTAAVRGEATCAA